MDNNLIESKYLPFGNNLHKLVLLNFSNNSEHLHREHD